MSPTLTGSSMMVDATRAAYVERRIGVNEPEIRTSFAMSRGSTRVISTSASSNVGLAASCAFPVAAHPVPTPIARQAMRIAFDQDCVLTGMGFSRFGLMLAVTTSISI